MDNPSMGMCFLRVGEPYKKKAATAKKSTYLIKLTIHTRPFEHIHISKLASSCFSILFYLCSFLLRLFLLQFFFSQVFFSLLMIHRFDYDDGYLHDRDQG
jgi:hypothetical protein